MKPLLLLCLLFIGCNQSGKVEQLEQEKKLLQKKVDSLSNEFQKCNMLLKAYEFDPMTS